MGKELPGRRNHGEGTELLEAAIGEPATADVADGPSPGATPNLAWRNGKGRFTRRLGQRGEAPKPAGRRNNIHGVLGCLPSLTVQVCSPARYRRGDSYRKPKQKRDRGTYRFLR